MIESYRLGWNDAIKKAADICCNCDANRESAAVARNDILDELRDPDPDLQRQVDIAKAALEKIAAGNSTAFALVAQRALKGMENDNT